jgi:hypothetical protein
VRLFCLAVRLRITPLQDLGPFPFIIQHEDAIIVMILLTAVSAILPALQMMIQHSAATLGQNLGEVAVIA